MSNVHFRYQFRDVDGGLLVIKDSGVEESTAVIEDMDDGVRIPAHQVAPICRALYTAAGLDVPKLPDVPDPAEVERLCNDLRDVMAHKPDRLSLDPMGRLSLDPMARELLARGWGRAR